MPPGSCGFGFRNAVFATGGNPSPPPVAHRANRRRTATRDGKNHSMPRAFRYSGVTSSFSMILDGTTTHGSGFMPLTTKSYAVLTA